MEENSTALTKSDVPVMFPDIPTPKENGEYSIGAEFVERENYAIFMIYNRVTGAFEYQTKLFTSSEHNFKMFCKLIGDYFNTTTLFEL